MLNTENVKEQETLNEELRALNYFKMMNFLVKEKLGSKHTVADCIRKAIELGLETRDFEECIELYNYGSWVCDKYSRGE